MKNREIKFRYRLKHLNPKKGYEEWFEYMTLDEIQGFNTTATIISRDQYTGLKDKDGKEIYEEDVIKIFYMPDGKQTENVIVKWDNNFASFGILGIKDDKITAMNHMYIRCEIIGNIYENPELIKG